MSSIEQGQNLQSFTEPEVVYVSENEDDWGTWQVNPKNAGSSKVCL
jgi:hypothetical protein